MCMFQDILGGKKMKTKEIITNLNNLAKVIRKDIDMPYELRRAMRKKL